ncbi:uncharacterized protein BO72DRAFT_461119 [Aspergillus fijiensis CBS 313.89]|uniref:Cyanovirin-N n=1 Tax=Aspergillus fijiensis CBS 313.89 TaxID=1448319 RepID=A0A8G1VW02_9EURO|nr:uncharacterized protein BO72DRAFT_461119 [Aspergillus fijiensis CBS 313.89]RAK74672.1 hypothetical protein BO72DRAFT_461119 [Aspergillus fijiensis CBS 313.89]
MHLTTCLTALALASMAVADQAIHIDGVGCGLFNGNGGVEVADKARVTITSSGNGILTCKAEVDPPASGKAVTYSRKNVNELCGVNGGLTDDWHETVSASGQATLTCRIKQ